MIPETHPVFIVLTRFQRIGSTSPTSFKAITGIRPLSGIMTAGGFSHVRGRMKTWKSSTKMN